MSPCPHLQRMSTARKGVSRVPSCVRWYPPKYPMIHDKGFLVLLLFSGLPESSACLSASEERKKNGDTSKTVYSTFNIQHRNKGCGGLGRECRAPTLFPLLPLGRERCLEFQIPVLKEGLTPMLTLKPVECRSHTHHVCSLEKRWKQASFLVVTFLHYDRTILRVHASRDRS